MPTYTDEEIRQAAIARYLEQNPGASTEQAELMVDRVLATMSRTEAIALYIDGTAPEDIPEVGEGPDALPVGTPEAPAAPPTEEAAAAETESEFLVAVEAAGVITTAPNAIIGPEEFTALLERYGADMEAAEILTVTAVAFPSMTMEQADGLARALAAQHPSAAQTQYVDVLEASGFSGAPIAVGTTTPSEVRGAPAELVTTEGSYIRQPETGWLQYTGGVLANPDTGEVVFDPNSTAAGSALWLKDVQETWTAEQITEWRKRLHEFGYLTKDEVKTDGVDQRFLGQLQAFHLDRYANFGKAVATDLAGMAGERPPLVDFADFQAQTRNDVREEYRRIFAEEPTEGEVIAFSEMIVRKGMELQRRYRRKGYSNYSGLAATEAEEAFIERLEQSPQAQFLREADEENTTLRDAMQQSAILMNSLAQ